MVLALDEKVCPNDCSVCWNVPQEAVETCRLRNLLKRANRDIGDLHRAVDLLAGRVAELETKLGGGEIGEAVRDGLTAGNGKKAKRK